MGLMLRIRKIMKKSKKMRRHEKKAEALLYSYKMKGGLERKRWKQVEPETKDKYVFSSIFPNAEVMQRIYKILQENSD